MNNRIFAIALVLLLYIPGSYAQEELPELTAKDSIVASAWMFGVGINIVDDSGDAFQDFTTIKDQWNMVPFPSRLSVGRYFRSGLGLEVIGTYNNYKEGNIIDGQVNPEDITYWAVDSRLSYDLNKLVGETGFFDPYVGVGVGYTDANNNPRGTYNGVVGFRLWFSDHWGADLNSSGKWSFGNDATNHIQHAAGVVYRWGVEKELSRKGRVKLAVREALLAEQQRLNDSIQQARDAEERARQLALEEERKRQEALAAAEARKQQEEAARKQALRDELAGLGTVGFAFNSSYLNEPSKETLRKIAGFMETNSTLTIGISGHTDSRGPEQYNLWLSEKRARRALDYLLGQGVDAGRITLSPMGETQLLNHCADGVSCTAAEHSVNRRVGVVIEAF
jgi:outer membrane protein OmpA-like peptidoglycan-associated protein